MELADKWVMFHAENPKIYQSFKDFALKAIKVANSKNIRYLSADMVMHRVRWGNFIANTDDKYKINNNWVAYYSRLFQAEHPEHSHLFRNRSTSVERAESENPGYLKI